MTGTVSHAAPRLAPPAVGCLLACLLGLVLAVVLPSPAQAQPGRSARPVCAPQDAVRILLLMDTSGSLKTADPDRKRQVGARAAAEALVSLSQEYPDVEMQAAVASFDADERMHLGWTAIGSQSREKIRAAVDESISDKGDWTDYGGALGAAVDLFESSAGDTCDIMLWFTDGAHDTVSGDEESERREIDSMCAQGGPADYLSSVGVFAVAVELVSDRSDASGVLRRLIGGVPGDDCRSVPGFVASADSPEELRRLLEDVVKSMAWVAAERVPQLGECEQAPGSECRLAFEVGPDDDGFDFYADTSALSPEERSGIGMSVVAPDGSAVFVPWTETTSQGTLLSGMPVMAERPSAPGWRVLRAHQAMAWSPETDGQVPDGWVGLWRVAFSGPGSAAVPVTVRMLSNGPVPAELRLDGESVAASVQAGDGPPPALRLSLGTGLPGSRPEWVGALAAGAEQSVGDGCEDQRQSQQWMDATELRLADARSVALDVLGPSGRSASAEYRLDVMECVQVGPVEVPWARPDSAVSLPMELHDLFWRNPSDILATVTRAELLEPLSSTAQLRVHAAPSVYETVLTLFDGAAAPVLFQGLVPQPGQSSASEGEETPLSLVPSGDPSHADWSCVVPPSSALPAAEFECDRVLVMDVETGAPEGQEAGRSGVHEIAMLASASPAVLSELSYDGEVSVIRAAEFEYDWGGRDMLAKAGGLLADLLVLAALWAAVRVANGLRIRPWDPSESATAAVSELTADSAGALRLGRTDTMFCPALNSRRSRADIGTVSVLSSLARAVIGQERSLEAVPSGDARLLAASPPSLVLEGGWAVTDHAGSLRLVTWGLPTAEADHPGRVAEAFEQACRQIRLAPSPPAPAPQPAADPLSPLPPPPGGLLPADD